MINGNYHLVSISGTLGKNGECGKVKKTDAIQLQPSPACRNVNLVWIDFLIKKPEVRFCMKCLDFSMLATNKNFSNTVQA